MIELQLTEKELGILSALVGVELHKVKELEERSKTETPNFYMQDQLTEYREICDSINQKVTKEVQKISANRIVREIRNDFA